MTVSKEDLLKGRTHGVHEVDVPEVGVVTVRPLNRQEATSLRLMGQEGATLDELEQKMVSMSMVEPKMTPEDVAAWQQASPAGDLEVVTAKIAEISGLNQGAPKAAYKQFRR